MSNRFRNLHDTSEVVITTKDVQESTVRDFIKVCHGEEVQLNANNAQEFLELATEWEVEGSNDGTNWIALDSQTNNESIATKKASHTFQTTNQTSSRSIRILSTGYNKDNTNCQCLTLTQVGTLI